MAFAGQTPTIIVLKEGVCSPIFSLMIVKSNLGRIFVGTDASQGKGQIISNINACVAVQSTIKSTLGPYGGDLLLVDSNGKQTITNDGATVMKVSTIPFTCLFYQILNVYFRQLLDIVHPAARILTDIARSQDAEVGDGTTSVVVLAGEILKEVRDSVEQGVSTQTIIKGLRRAGAMAVNKIKEISIDMLEASGSEEKKIETLRRLAGTAMNSKLIKRNSEFFTKSEHIYIESLCLRWNNLTPVLVVVDAVLSLDQDDLNEKLIGMKKVHGGALQDSLFVDGVAFKKTFSYAGFEQQPKHFKNPKIVCLNVELELKSEKDNAEVRVEQVSEYQAIVDAEWQIIYNKLEALYKTGAKVVLSKLPIGDLATQYAYTHIYRGNKLLMIIGTLPTVIYSVLAVLLQRTWSEFARPPVLPYNPPAPISRNAISEHAVPLKSDKSVASASTSFQNALPQRHVHSSCAVVQNNSSPKSNEACTTPS